jgi:hypothetical protein
MSNGAPGPSRTQRRPTPRLRPRARTHARRRRDRIRILGLVRTQLQKWAGGVVPRVTSRFHVLRPYVRGLSVCNSRV